eukprot:6462242-Amphidinium_carterae.3
MLEWPTTQSDPNSQLLHLLGAKDSVAKLVWFLGLRVCTSTDSGYPQTNDLAEATLDARKPCREAELKLDDRN